MLQMGLQRKQRNLPTSSGAGGQTQKITAQLLIPTLCPAREIIDIKRDMSGDCIIRQQSLLVADDHIGQSLLGWFFALLFIGV